MESEAGKKDQFKDATPMTRCIRCGIATAGACPRCKKYVCWKQACNESHDMKCPPVGGGAD